MRVKPPPASLLRLIFWPLASEIAMIFGVLCVGAGLDPVAFLAITFATQQSDISNCVGATF